MSDSITIHFSAEFEFDGASLVVTQYQTGNELRISIRTSISSWGSAQTYLYGGYDYSTGSTRKGAWTFAEEPAGILSYSGPVLIEASVAKRPAKFCGECGHQRIRGGAFCSNCGSKFRDASSQAGDLFDEFIMLAQGVEGESEIALRLYETYCLSAVDTKAAAILRKFLDQAEPRLTNFVNGKENKPAKHGKISLGQSQFISEKLKSGHPLSNNELDLARTIMQSAPVTFGYWGAIKAALKYLPIVGNEKYFGVALANISNAPSIQPAGSDSRFNTFVGLAEQSSIPGTRTLNYMSRRICRELKRIVETNPSSYIEVAKHFAINWRGPYRSRSFAAGFIFHGGVPYIENNGRAIDQSLDLGNLRRTEAFTHLWDQYPQAAFEILSSGVKSSKALTLAFQVLEDSSLTVPALESDQIEYALNSPYRPLRQNAIATLALAEKDYWRYFKFQTWVLVFSDASDAQLHHLFARYRAHDFPSNPYSFWRAIQLFIVEHQQTGPEGDLPANRLSEITAFAIAHPQHLRLNWGTRLPVLEAALSTLGEEILVLNPNALDAFFNDELAELIKRLERAGKVFPSLLRAIESRAIIASGNSDYSRLSYIRGFLELESDNGLKVALAILNAEPSDSVMFGLLDLEAVRDLSKKFRAKFINHFILHAPIAKLPNVLQKLEEESHMWPGFSLQFALTQDGGTKLAWQILATDSLSKIHEEILSSKTLIKNVGDSLQLSDVKTASGAQAELLIAYLASDKMRVKLDPEFVFAAAVSATPSLSQAGLEALSAHKLVSKYWLRLAESGLPDCMEICRAHLRSIGNATELTASVLALLDSATQSAKKLGLSFLDAPANSLDLEVIWSSLTESEDSEILARVAEEALVRESIPDDRLEAMDKRVLVSRRKSRVAKEAVKQRLEKDRLELAPERLSALLELARAHNSRDREWAISRLAILSVSGLNIPTFEAYEVSGGTPNG